ncbi:MAG: STM3941 family protein [Pseudomonadota bacterium]
MEPIILYPSRWKLVVLVAVCLAFVALSIGLLMVGQTEMGWLGVGLFSACAVVFTAQFLPRSNYLIVDGEGFEFRTWRQGGRYHWSAVSGIASRNIKSNRLVIVDLKDDAGAREIALPDTYGLKANVLAELLGKYLENWHRTARTGMKLDQSRS